VIVVVEVVVTMVVEVVVVVVVVVVGVVVGVGAVNKTHMTQQLHILTLATAPTQEKESAAQG
jgi:hypothetical protein